MDVDDLMRGPEDTESTDEEDSEFFPADEHEIEEDDDDTDFVGMASPVHT